MYENRVAGILTHNLIRDNQRSKSALKSADMDSNDRGAPVEERMLLSLAQPPLSQSHDLSFLK